MKLNKEELYFLIGYLQEPSNLGVNEAIMLANIFSKLRKQMKRLEDKEAQEHQVADSFKEAFPELTKSFEDIMNLTIRK